LDACRQLKSMGGLTDYIAGLFRSGMEVADIFCVVREGAELTVSEPTGVGRARFIKYRALDAASVLKAAVMDADRFRSAAMDKAAVICKLHEIADHYLRAGTWPVDREPTGLFQDGSGVGIE
jgi:hypothetical protein